MLSDDLGEKIFFSEVLEFLRVVFNVIENHDNYNIWLGHSRVLWLFCSIEGIRFNINSCSLLCNDIFINW